MSSPVMDLLASRPLPALAAAVRNVIPRTMERWDRVVREALPTAHVLTLEQLRDDLPKVLQFMADVVETGLRYDKDALSDISTLHGEVRYEQGFNLNEVLIEYSILRVILMEDVAGELGRELNADEVVSLAAVTDATVRRAVVRFVAHLTSQLQAATESQSKYLSFLSHDLRGGLNGVFLMIEVLKRELAGEARLAETVEDLDVMRRSLLDTVGTMDRFLHAERFRKGKVQVRPTQVTLKNILLENAAHFTYQAKEKKVNLRVDAPADLVIVSDKELLTLVFQNLFSNALKYTHPQTTVAISARRANSVCIVSVTDEGPGIASDKLNELFAPFARGETYGQPGVGLGLTIARQASQCLGAKLWAESQLGHGSTFFVEFPPEIRQEPATGDPSPPTRNQSTDLNLKS